MKSNRSSIVSRRSSNIRSRYRQTARYSIAFCLILLGITGCTTARQVPPEIVRDCPIPDPPIADMIPCSPPIPLPQYVQNLDATVKIEQEAWLDEKNKNITRNMRNAKDCAISHQLLANYIRNLPEC